MFVQPKYRLKLGISPEYNVSTHVSKLPMPPPFKEQWKFPMSALNSSYDKIHSLHKTGVKHQQSWTISRSMLFVGNKRKLESIFCHKNYLD